MSNAILDSADVANPISKDKLEGWLESIDDVPQSLLAVIVANLQDIEKDGMVSFSKIETVKFTGSQLLQDLVEVEEDEFRRQWCNLLPEKWRDAIDINELSVSSHTIVDAYADEAKIRWQSISGRKIRAVSSDGEKSAGNASTTSTTTTKRKWHEKFKQARKA
ncbi:Hypothetical protein D9617_3g018510 [Elsinoe fawcettii]|nr:Hypothetical protein D9617_3g018510 [Elsinoe fawcettii]